MNDKKYEQKRLSAAAVLVAAVQAGLNDKKLFQRLCDIWFAYKRGEPFIGPKGGIQSLSIPRNKNWKELPPAPKRVGGAADFVSTGALEVKRSGVGLVMLDHSVPQSELRRGLFRIHGITPEKVEDYLQRTFRLALITRDEDKRFGSVLSSEMPPDWDGKDVTVRYRAAGIDLT
ncbi:MAG: hypothetical protein AAGH90_04135 [Pseudomonadota bacterium]